MNWLITGGCGFIGVNLIHNLMLEGEHYIRIVDNLSVGSRQDLLQVCDFQEFNSNNIGNQFKSRKIELVVGDILNAELAIEVCRDMDIVVHLAANTGVALSVDDPRADCLTNVLGVLNYLEASRHNHLKRFIFASSSAPVGECLPPICEKLAPHPVSPYGASKLAGEGYCSAYFRTYGLKTVVLRFGNVYGPFSARKNSVVAKFIKKAEKGETLEIYGDGEQTRDFIYIDDLIRAIRLSATTNGISGEIFQIATNTETTISELVEQIIITMASFGCNDIDVCHTNSRMGDVKRNFSDTSKAHRMLEWQTEVDLKEGLRSTVNWFLSKGDAENR